MEEKVKEILAEVLNLPQDSVNESMTFENTDSWDSLKHMEIVSALEEELGIVFTADEIVSMTSYNAIIKLVTEKKG